MDLPNSEPDEEGGLCTFYTVGNKGLKVWHSYEQAEDQWVNQTRACAVGCGPKVLSEIEKVRGHKLWGFYTELATLHRPHSYKDLVNLHRRFKREFGYDYPDLHDYNIGHVNGKLVFIDFDS